MRAQELDQRLGHAGIAAPTVLVGDLQSPGVSVLGSMGVSHAAEDYQPASGRGGSAARRRSADAKPQAAEGMATDAGRRIPRSVCGTAGVEVPGSASRGRSTPLHPSTVHTMIQWSFALSAVAALLCSAEVRIARAQDANRAKLLPCDSPERWRERERDLEQRRRALTGSRSRRPMMVTARVGRLPTKLRSRSKFRTQT